MLCTCEGHASSRGHAATCPVEIARQNREQMFGKTEATLKDLSMKARVWKYDS